MKLYLHVLLLSAFCSNISILDSMDDAKCMLTVSFHYLSLKLLYSRVATTVLSKLIGENVGYTLVQDEVKHSDNYTLKNSDPRVLMRLKCEQEFQARK